MSKTKNLRVISWKTKGLSSKIVKPPTRTNNSLNSKLDYFNVPKFQIKFEGRCLKTIIKPFTLIKIIIFYIIYEIKL